MNKVAVIGATSAIAHAVMRRLVSASTQVVLVGRNPQRLEQVADDLRSRGSEVQIFVEDVNKFDSNHALVGRIWETLNGCDMLILAHGNLPHQLKCQDSVEGTLDAFNTNALSFISLLTLFAGKFEAQRSGIIVVMSSVAGDRGRKSNYIYGSAKAAVTVFTSGLRNRLAASGVHVLTVKPGLIDTPMTKDFEKGYLWSSPDRAARDIIGAIVKRRHVVYVPSFWRPIMFVIRLIPERIFIRTNL